MRDKVIQGNIAGISNALLAKMQEMYDFPVSKDLFISEELAQSMAEFSSFINREISVLITRNGIIKDISIGEHDRAEFPKLSTKRSSNRLSGVRCIHTHPGGNGRLSSVDYATLSDAMLDSMAAIGVKDGKVTDLYAAFLLSGKPEYHTIGPLKTNSEKMSELMLAVYESDKNVGRVNVHKIKETHEKAILVGIKDDGMEELKELALTAGAKVVFSEVQNRDVPDRGTYLGRGKVDELHLKIGILNADLLIVNAEISPIQQRNLEERLGIKVVDRTALILDIFAMRAKSKEGCLQVELAQMKYLLPRLIGKGFVLSRQAGTAGGMGIASRGPGETKLELDRRHIRKRINILEQELNRIEKQRKNRRNQRFSSSVPKIALVGYTNAGKSTLLNALTGSEAYVEDKLFATLDPLTRKMKVDGKDVIVTDTVGFVQDLPHDLIKAFHSTLEEVIYANLLIHVVDGSDAEMMSRIEVVKGVIDSLEADEIPIITVFNKREIATAHAPESMIAISAKTGKGIDNLRKAILAEISSSWRKETIRIPYSRSDLISFLHENGTVVSEDYQEDEMVFEVELSTSDVRKIKSKLKETLI